jgi:hypothetical protein
MATEPTTTALEIKKSPIYTSVEEAKKVISKSKVNLEIQKTLADYKAKAKELLAQGEIDNEITAKKADELLSEMNKYSNSLDKKGKEVRDPYTQTAKIIKAIFDEYGAEVEVENKSLRDALAKYIKAENDKKAAAARKVQEQKDTLTAWVKKASAEIMTATTEADTMAIGTKYIKPFKKELFDLLDEEVVVAALNAVKGVGKQRLEQLKNKDVSDPGIEEVNSEEMLESTNEALEAIADIPEAESAPVIKMNMSLKKDIKWKLWKSEEEVDKSMMSVDPKKVKEYLDANRDAIKTSLDTAKPGQHVSVLKKGIQFYYEEGTRVN